MSFWGEESLKKIKPTNLRYQVWISQETRPKSRTFKSEVSSLNISRNQSNHNISFRSLSQTRRSSISDNFHSLNPWDQSSRCPDRNDGLLDEEEKEKSCCCPSPAGRQPYVRNRLLPPRQVTLDNTETGFEFPFSVPWWPMRITTTVAPLMRRKEEMRDVSRTTTQITPVISHHC